jgi:DNA-binding response OmpR family regulator
MTAPGSGLTAIKMRREALRRAIAAAALTPRRRVRGDRLPPGYDWFGPTKTLDVHVAALRKRLSEVAASLDPPADGPTITTLRGFGYRLDP